MSLGPRRELRFVKALTVPAVREVDHGVSFITHHPSVANLQ